MLPARTPRPVSSWLSPRRFTRSPQAGLGNQTTARRCLEWTWDQSQSRWSHTNSLQQACGDGFIRPHTPRQSACVVVCQCHGGNLQGRRSHPLEASPPRKRRDDLLHLLGMFLHEATAARADTRSITTFRPCARIPAARLIWSNGGLGHLDRASWMPGQQFVPGVPSCKSTNC